jgi:hypothetical protein
VEAVSSSVSSLRRNSIRRFLPAANCRAMSLTRARIWRSS